MERHQLIEALSAMQNTFSGYSILGPKECEQIDMDEVIHECLRMAVNTNENELDHDDGLFNND